MQVFQIRFGRGVYHRPGSIFWHSETGRHLFSALLPVGHQRRGCAQRRRAGDQVDLARQGLRRLGCRCRAPREHGRGPRLSIASRARANPHVRVSSGQMGNRRVPDFWYGVGSLCQLHFEYYRFGRPGRVGRIDLVRQPITDRAHRPCCPRWRHVRSQYVLAFYLQRG